LHSIVDSDLALASAVDSVVALASLDLVVDGKVSATARARNRRRGARIGVGQQEKTGLT
jgi:hypothetical protein